MFMNRKTDTPKEEIGIGGFTMLARVQETTKLKSTIPTAHVENGSKQADHIILEPISLTINGNVSDVHIAGKATTQALTRVQAEIGNIAQYAPVRTQSEVAKVNALINDAANALRKVNAALEAGVQALNFFGNQDSESKTLREQFKDKMEELHYKLELIEVNMPFRQYSNMRITSITMVEDNATEEINFSLELQEFRFSDLIYTQVVRKPSKGLGGQTEPKSDKGAQEGKPVPRSLLSSLLGS